MLDLNVCLQSNSQPYFKSDGSRFRGKLEKEKSSRFLLGLESGKQTGMKNA
ncbi:hypothetical protein V6Z11_A09G184700 [Gossypium hirsutum]